MSKKRALKEKIMQKDQKSDSQSNYSLPSDEGNKPTKEKNQKGEEFWALTKNKRVSVGKFSGKTNVNIRQFFEKDGKWLPTKKGITLSIESWNTLKTIIEDVDEAINESQAKV